jgi:hypothetical protein
VKGLQFTGDTLGSPGAGNYAVLGVPYSYGGQTFTFQTNKTSLTMLVSGTMSSPAFEVSGAAKVLPASSTLTIAPAKAKVASAKAKVVSNASNTVTSNTVVIPATNATASNMVASNTVVVAPAGLVHVVPAIALPSPTPASLPVLNYVAFAQNPNQKQVASALNSFQSAPSPDQQVVVATLDVMAAEGSVSQAYNAIMPSYYQSLGTIAFNLANAQNSELVQRLWGLRVAEGTGFSMNGMPDNTPVVEGQGDGKSVADPSKDILRPGADSHWGMFVDGNGVFAQANSGNMLPGYNSQSGGITTGLTYKWNENVATGIYAGYQGTYTKSGATGSGLGVGSTLIDNAVRFGVFGSYGQKNSKGEPLGFYANALAGGGYNNYQSSRIIDYAGLNRTANSSPGAGELDTMLGGGYDLNHGNFTYGPTASLQYTYL